MPEGGPCRSCAPRSVSIEWNCPQCGGTGIDPTEFSPDWASPPGDTIRDMLKERHCSPTWLATRIARPHGMITRLLSGTEPLSEELAADLAAAIGGTKEFWLKRELHYRQALKASDGFERELP